MLVHPRVLAMSSLALLGLTGTSPASAQQSYPPPQYPSQPPAQYQPQAPYQAPAAAPARPQSAYAVQPRSSYATAGAQAQPIPSQAVDPYRVTPAQAAAPATANPAGSYPPAQPYPPAGVGQPGARPTSPQPGYAQPGNPQPGYPQPGSGAATAQPLRVAQQPSAGGQTVSTTVSDMTPAPMAGSSPMATPTGVPVELNPHLGAGNEHPLAPAIRWAASELNNIRTIQDYSCIFYKRERIDGQLGGYQAMYMKVRHEPFSVYMYFKSPSNLEGQEVIYVKGLNENNLQAHTTGIKSVVGTVSLSPTGTLAMKGNRYPITEAGILNLLERLVAVGNKDMQYGECDVQFFTSAQGVKVGGRPCTCIQVTHPVPRRNFLFHLARIYIDEELRVPIRYESYDWPTQPGGQPLLMEEYTYQNLKLNNGFSDIDFDVRNPKYGFK